MLTILGERYCLQLYLIIRETENQRTWVMPKRQLAANGARNRIRILVHALNSCKSLSILDRVETKHLQMLSPLRTGVHLCGPKGSSENPTSAKTGELFSMGSWPRGMKFFLGFL